MTILNDLVMYHKFWNNYIQNMKQNIKICVFEQIHTVQDHSSIAFGSVIQDMRCQQKHKGVPDKLKSPDAEFMTVPFTL